MNARVAIILAFVAGFVDTATFVGARGVFSAHVTGNFVLFSVALIKGIREIDYLKIFLFVPFILAVGTVAYFYGKKHLTLLCEKKLLLTSSVLLIIPAFYFMHVTELKDDLWDLDNLFIMLPVLAMGIQNGLYRIKNPTDPMTTVMTGNVTTMMIELITKGFTAKCKALLTVIAAFSIGCFIAAFCVDRFSLVSLLLPGLILVLHAFTMKDKI